MSRAERFTNWLLSPGMTGFTRMAHSVWCLGGFLQYLLFMPALGWFGYACWNHDLPWAMTAGFAVVACFMLTNVTMVVASKMLTTESIYAKQAGRDDLDF